MYRITSLNKNFGDFSENSWDKLIIPCHPELHGIVGFKVGNHILNKMMQIGELFVDAFSMQFESS
jgi:hypothetical protein